MSADNVSGGLTQPVGEHDHAEGPSNAKVTLVEYGDYQCPYCGSAYLVVKQVQQEMGKELRFVFRNFPLREAHPHAVHAAIAAEAVGARDDDAFWKMHDTLYEHQRALDDDDLTGYAEALGVAPSELAGAYAGGPFADRVRADFRSGVRSGVNGTPTFFINGVRYDGDWTKVSAFVGALRAAAKAQS